MPYCQNCGAEVAGNFCPTCGAQSGSVLPNMPKLIIHEGAIVKPRYSTGAMVLAGYLGFCFLLMFLVFFIAYTVHLLGGTMSIIEYLGALVACAILFGIAFLCYLPGINSIRKRSPEGMAMRTFWSFFGKTLLFVICWFVAITGCVYIVGLFCKSWRLGLWVSRPNNDQYTAFVDGKKIPVTRYYDDLPDYGARGKWVYRANNGEFYRPPVK